MADEKEVNNSEEENNQEDVHKRNLMHGKRFKVDLPVIFGYVVKGIFGLILIGIIVLIGFIIFNLARSGQLGVYTKDVVVNVDNSIDSQGLFGWFKTQWEWIKDPAKMRTYRSVVEANEENENLGVKIVSFEVPNEKVFEGDPIVGVAVVQAASISDNTSRVKFDCELEDYNGDYTVKPDYFEYPGNGIVKRVNVMCDFDSSNLYLPNKINAKQIKFKNIFESKTLASYDVYIMKKDKYEFINYELGKNVFDYYGISDPLLSGDGVMRSVTTAGPVNLAIGTETSQPFVYSPEDGMEYYIQVDITPQWRGDIKYVKDLRLKVPEEIELVEDPRTCDFEFSGEYDGGYKVYHLTPYAMEHKVNVDCSQERLDEVGLSEESCVRYFRSGGIQTQCWFKVPSYPEDWSDIVRTSFVAELDYVFESTTSRFVQIYKKEGAKDNVCESYGESRCKEVKGCEPRYNEGNFSGCVMCNVDRCEDYRSEEDCNNDYCGVGECAYVNGVCGTKALV